eukprot:gb/GEZJ01000219.1/.p2 GENE.gb/GEZJ01000219.1/~~gb/GEZJ01000219.1/.p2  ORF type:complete len:409 (-),score=32.31 gb/GEZJ01000219.1/:2922-4148(-)
MALKSNDLTVMGPAMTVSPRKPTDPPPFDSTTVKFKWRNKVCHWGRIVKRMSDGGFKYARATWSALVDTLYLAVDDSVKQLLDHTILEGFLSLDRSEDDEDSSKMIEKMLNIVAEDTPTENVKRLVMMMKNIHQCTRAATETPIEYARRFQGLASIYLTHSNAGNSTQNGQLFSMLLIENARLPEATTNHIVLQLVNDTTQRPFSDLKEKISVSQFRLRKLDEEMRAIRQGIDTPSMNIEDVRAHLSSGETILEAICNDDLKLRQQENRIHITLDAAVRAISEITVSTTPTTKTPFIPTVTTMLGAQEKSPGGLKDRTRFAERKAVTTCRACGQRGHWWRDRPSCTQVILQKSSSNALVKTREPPRFDYRKKKFPRYDTPEGSSDARVPPTRESTPADIAPQNRSFFR